jgi:hypothetical protein
VEALGADAARSPVDAVCACAAVSASKNPATAADIATVTIRFMEVHPRLISNPTVSDWRAKVNHAPARNTALFGIVATPLPGAGCVENRYHFLGFML